jgi:hypothetical protein
MGWCLKRLKKFNFQSDGFLIVKAGQCQNFEYRTCLGTNGDRQIPKFNHGTTKNG